MILTVTPNAAVDRTLRVERLRPGTRHAVLADAMQAGGKGVNVARVLHTLGVPVRALVLVGGAAGEWIVRELEESGVAVEAVRAEGESRTCLEILEEGSAAPTQVHTRGVVGSRRAAEALLERLGSLLAETTWCAVCGSLPPGLPADLPADAVDLCHERGVRIGIDTSGAPLADAWKHGPDLVRVNHAEAAAVDEGERTAAGLTVVTRGEDPFDVWTAGGEAWRVTPPTVATRNPIGCGDAMLAGLLSRLGDSDVPAALRYATALAAADAESDVAGRPDPARGRALESAVRVDPINRSR